VRRQGRRHALLALLVLAILALSAPAVFAASEVGDTGELPATAQELGPAGPLVYIDGNISSTTDRDMYKVCLRGGGDFTALTTGLAGFDTQLFLLDAQGRAVYANDDAPGSRQSRLPGFHALTPTAPGTYYLAIAPHNWDPANTTAGPLFPDRSGTAGPEHSQPITHWVGSNLVAMGRYTIALAGTNSCIVPDEAAPTIDLDAPADGATYTRGQEVIADYSCEDEAGGSGLATCTGTVPDGQAIDTASLGTKSFTVTAEDNEGNTRSVTHTYTVVDDTDPTVTLTTPADAAVYDRDQVVAADYACADEDGGSGLESCVGTVPDGDAVDTSTLGTHSFTVTARDGQGNSSSVTHSYRVVARPPADQTGPVINLSRPADGAFYGLDEDVVVAFSCSDEGSGVASCSGDQPAGSRIDTSEIGARSFTVRAVDGAGNVSTATSRYRVGFQFEGFFGPVRNRPHVNVWKAGTPVPMIFSLDGYQGRGVIASGYPRSTEIRCGTSPDTLGTAGTRALAHSRLRYKPKRDLYVYLWKTDKRWAGECRQFVLKLDDGSYHRADFRFAPKKTKPKPKPKPPHHGGGDGDDDDD
jgi:hypothetical protein